MMEKALSELGVSYKYFPAVDGKYVTLHNHLLSMTAMIGHVGIIFSLSLCNKERVKEFQAQTVFICSNKVL